ncbi:hypothetical protein JT362_34750 [Actinophytocola sp. S1-96]|uniref:Carrier domain-containing protein n=1 Tax=Actinophytocola gossypii TaxID=2812003 RepID=A0ABT2JK68_9PSEU|nr:hypothetical protein [Actinophytocola gossypii]
MFWKLNPTSPAYNIPEVIHFDGEFDPAAVQFALDETVRRHEALRTTFRETESGVVQVVSPDPLPMPVKVTDLRGVPETERADRLAATLYDEANAPFDLATDLPVRLTAIRVTDARTSVLLVVHHIVCDGTSIACLLKEYAAFYRAAREDTPPDLPPAPPGYTEVVRQQLAALSGPNLREELDYWRDRLTGVRGSALPRDRDSRPTANSLRTDAVSTVLEPELAAAVLEHARRARTTPFAVLLCAMQVMIAIGTSEDEVALGTVTSGRPRRFAATVGMLANTVVIKSAIDRAASFAAVLDDVSLDVMDALDYQDLPYSRVIAELHGSGRGQGDDLVRTMFVAAASSGRDAGAKRDYEIPAYRVEGPFELIVLCHVMGEVVALDWEFALRSYSRETAAGYRDAYREILAALLRDPDAPIDSLKLTDVLARLVPNAYPPSAAGAPNSVTSGVEPPAAGTSDNPAADDAVLSPVEEAVAAIWSEILDIPVTAPSDNFFQLGGHSMVASRAVALVRRKVAPATMRLLFDHPELRDFCAQLPTTR